VLPHPGVDGLGFGALPEANVVGRRRLGGGGGERLDNDLPLGQNWVQRPFAASR
jgi:hypothetical protein